ncbi:MAG: glycoside hydrolase family 88 protein [Propionibacteriaceae bacterium]|nr:glycoside hydrolase family 88 protein [Propionibacteriaceae bacterium]
MSEPFDAALARATRAVQTCAHEFGTDFPGDCTLAGRYRHRPGAAGLPDGANLGWTTGFRTGMLWLCAQVTGQERFADAASADVASFAARLRDGVELDTHDLGFLYSLSCVNAWLLTRDAAARQVGLAAADRLLTRVVEPAGIIQAWGSLDDPAQRGRAIVDSLMNLPLLYWASQTSGDPRYAHAATRHARQLRDHIVRADGTTYHTFFWDPGTGAPLRGATHQGHDDASCWARGQAWAIYGFALAHRHSGEQLFWETSKRCADAFWVRLPSDRVPYWDLVFTDGSSQPRDSSAGAIAACGLLELAIASPDARSKAEALVTSLIDHCAAPAGSDALLLHGVYNLPGGEGIDEATLWGDYFYLEALTRLTHPACVLPW